MSNLITTVFYVGRLPWAPGTFGSLAALPMAYLLHRYCGFQVFFAITVLVFLIGWLATFTATWGRSDHDPSAIVIDEVVGQWIALWPLSAGLLHAGVDPAISPYPGWIAAFILFRFFDILKPWPVSWADKKTTALGVMLDDVLAGVLAAICVSALAWYAHSGAL